MAKIDVDAYDPDEVYAEAYNDFPSDDPSGSPKKNNKRKAVKIRRTITRVLVLALSAGGVYGAYKAVPTYFDKVLESDKEVEVIPSGVLDLIPSSLFSSLLDKVTGAAGIDTEAPEEESGDEEEEFEAIDDPNILSSTTPVSDSYMEASVFVGDERLLGFVEEDLLNANLIYGESGMSPADFLEHEFVDPVTNLTGTLSTLLPAREPEHIYMLMGLNGIDDETFIDTYKELIESVKKSCPGVPIVVCSLLPVNEEEAVAAGLSESITNGMINATNKQLLSMCRDEGVYFLNAYSKIAADGALKESYDSGDGIILSDDGYEAWLSYIQKHAVPTS